MKMLCISDEIDNRIYDLEIRNRYKDIDCVICAGDLPLDYCEYIVSSLDKPCFFVFGNHNLEEIGVFEKKFRNNFENFEDTHGLTYIDKRIIRFKNRLIAGLGGSYLYNGNTNQWTEVQMFFRILHLLPGLLWNKIVHKRYIDIFVTHSPSFGLGDRIDICHRGFKVFKLFLKLFKPSLHIHGHIHLYDVNEKREQHYHETLIINTFKSKIIDLDKNDFDEP